MKLTKTTMASDIRTNFFSNRVVNKWNGLKQETVLGKTLNSSVVVLSMTLNSCGAIEEMIL